MAPPGCAGEGTGARSSAPAARQRQTTKATVSAQAAPAPVHRTPIVVTTGPARGRPAARKRRRGDAIHRAPASPLARTGLEGYSPGADRRTARVLPSSNFSSVRRPAHSPRRCRCVLQAVSGVPPPITRAPPARTAKCPARARTLSNMYSDSSHSTGLSVARAATSSGLAPGRRHRARRRCPGARRSAPRALGRA